MEATEPAALDRAIKESDLLVSLVGNPNVGKSCVFNHCTGLGVVTAHYPGKTTSINAGILDYGDRRIGLLDLPGVYSLDTGSEEQWVVRRTLFDFRPNVNVVIVDATNLERNLFLVLQMLDLDLPVVVALNLMDEARRAHIEVDRERLSKLLGVPVVTIQAACGKGLPELLQAVLQVSKNGQRPPRASRYGKDIEEHIAELSVLLQADPELRPPGYSPRAVAFALLEDDVEVRARLSQYEAGRLILHRGDDLAEHIGEEHAETASARLVRERFGLAGYIAAEVRTERAANDTLANRFWAWSIAPLTGIPTLIGILLLTFLILFTVGNQLAAVVEDTWAVYASPAITAVLTALVGDGSARQVLSWGFDAGLVAVLTVGIPYVLTFYFLLSIMEDTGYLNSVAFLLDNVMHKFGLHGRSAITLVAAAGCNVPAMMAIDSLPTRREKFIASTLVVLVPCTARTAVILGVVGHYLGTLAALALVGIIGLIIFLVGAGLDRLLPGQTSGLVMEMFPFRAPELRTVLRKTWYQFKDFVFVALPVVVGGSLVLGFLYESGYIWLAAQPLQGLFEGWLGIPTVAGLCLILAVLRKEMAMQLLMAIAAVELGGRTDDLLLLMNTNQMFVYALVNSIFIPCLATLAVLQKKLGWWKTMQVSMITALIALSAGGIVIRLLNYFRPI